MPRLPWNPFRSGRVACLLAATTVVCSTACGLLLDVQTAQCTVDGDCASLGANLVCRASSCVSSALNGDAGLDAAGDAGPACTSNAQCMDQNTGEPYLCLSGACVKVKSAECSEVIPETDPTGKVAYPSIRDDNVVLAASFARLAGSGLADPIVLSNRLAVNELNAAGGLPGGTQSPRRPIALLLCDSTPTVIDKAVAHVTDDLKIPALISLFSQTDMARIVQDTLVPKDVFTLNPQDTTEALEHASINRLLWSLLGKPEDVAVAYPPLLTRVETFLRKTMPAPIKVALIVDDAPTEQAINAVLTDATSGLHFNGANVATNTTNHNFQAFPISSLETNPGATFTDAINGVAAFHPNVVIALTGNEAGAIIPYVEQQLAADGGAAALPFYILSLRNSEVPTLVSYLASNANNQSSADKVQRFIGLNYASSTDTSQKLAWQQRMALANPQVDPSVYADWENYYDAVYWLAYGFYAAGPGAPLNGDSFKTGVRTMIGPGPSVFPGSASNISTAFTTMTTAQTTTFTGALGPPSFNSATGAQNSVGSVFCYNSGVLSDGGLGVTTEFDAVRYDDAGALSGTLDCILGF